MLDEAKVPEEETGLRSREMLFAMDTLRQVAEPVQGFMAKVGLLNMNKLNTKPIRPITANNRLDESDRLNKLNKRCFSANGRSEKPLALKHRLL